ncbi:hypothetical protein [Pseudomonas vranovensis]|nr:hypothetical protein [Pseudomonas vranovensis]
MGAGLIAAKVALDYLRLKHNDSSYLRDIAAPIALNEPHLGR